MAPQLLNIDEIEIALDQDLITPEQANWNIDQLERERCKADLFYLATQILNYSDLTESVHKPLCELVQSVNPLVMALASGAIGQANTHVFAPKATSNSIDVAQIQHSIGSLQSVTHITDRNVIDDVNEKQKLEKVTSGEGGGAQADGTSTQNLQEISTISSGLISSFSLPNTPQIKKLIEAKIIQFNPESRTRLFLLFRGAFKSTIITIAHTIQLMLIWPDIRILIASHKKEGGSQKFLGSIKDHFIRNDRFRKLFPEYCPKANTVGQIEWGTSEMVTLPNRSAKAIYPEATIEIAGNTTDVTGRHYDYLKIDDIVTRESVTNESMLEKTEEFNALLTFLFNQPEWGISDYAGTCYHFADLYSSLRNSDQITKFILPVWDENKVPTIPERFTSKGIEQIRNHPSMTSYQFSAQYLMNPVPAEDQTFRPEYFNRPGFYYEKVPNDLKMYVLVDPANAQRKESDYTALMSIGIDSYGDLWFVDIVRDKLTLEGRARLVSDILIRNKLHVVHYESIGFQSSDIKSIREMGQQRDWYITVNEVKASKQSKEDRIRGLQYYFEQGKVHFPKRYTYFSKYHNREYDMVEVFRRELWMFPSCEKDDLADCASFILRTGMIKSATAMEAAAPVDAWAFWKQTIAESKKKNTGTFNGNNKGFREIPSQKSWR